MRTRFTHIIQRVFLRSFMFKNIFSRFISDNSSSAYNNSSIISYKPVKTNEVTDYYNLSNDGYKQNIVVFRCINLIARAIGSVNWLLKEINDETDSIIYKHSILSLIERPNTYQSKTIFMENAVSQLLLSGNCYIMATRGADDLPNELHLLRPDRVNVIPGRYAIPAGYEYTVGNHVRYFPVDADTGASDISQVKLFNSLNDWYGMSPVEVALKSIQQHNAIAQQNISFLQNGGRPSGALLYKHELDSQLRQELKRDLRALYEGGRNAGKIMLLEGDFEWKEMGLSPKDLDFIDGKEQAAKEIALAFGVPPILISNMTSATFANYKEARYNFWEETILPLLNLITNELSVWLKQLFRTNLVLTYDMDSIPALVTRREAEWRKINAATFLTNDEKREAVGYGATHTSVKHSAVPNTVASLYQNTIELNS